MEISKKYQKSSLRIVRDVALAVGIILSVVALFAPKYFIVTMLGIMGVILVVAIVAALVPRGQNKPAGGRMCKGAATEEGLREALKGAYLQEIYGTFSFYAERNVEANKFRDGTVAPGVSGIKLRLYESSIYVYMEDDSSSHVLLCGGRGVPVLHMTIRLDEEGEKQVTLNFGSYVIPEGRYSCGDIVRAVSAGSDHIQHFRLFP